VVAVVLALTTIGAAPAHAATANAQLYLGCEDGFGNRFDYAIVVRGTVARSYPDGFSVTYRVWGDDPSSDDLLAGPFTVTGELPASPGSPYEVSLCSNHDSTFDEDIGTDEIYFGIRIFDNATGQQREVVESNRIVYGF